MLKFHPLRIVSVEPDGQDAVAIALEVPPQLQAEYRGAPGQHVVLRALLEGEELRRTYSLVNTPGEWPLRIVARVHEHGRMSRHLAEQAHAGNVIDVLPPNGSLTPRCLGTSAATEAREFAGFASGCGITPVIAIARALLAAQPRHRFILFYGNTSTERAMCLEELLALKDRYLERLALHFVMSREPQEVELYNGRLDGERVKQFATTLFDPAQIAEYFVCGPGDMIERIGAALRELHVPSERIHGEHFRVAASDTPGSPEEDMAARASPGTASPVQLGEPKMPSLRPATQTPKVAPPASADMAEVTVQMDGRRRTFSMHRNGESVLDAAARAGLDLPFSCRAGVCSTCRTKVISGEVAMAQNYALEDWELEQGYILACQASVKTPTLELDYDEK